ncbi:MAG: C-GCAxxG-C-C family (seleno)protein [Eubacteriales bacterium]
MVTQLNLQKVKETADDVFRNGFTCGETVVFTLNKEYELGLPDSVISLASGFPFGFGDGGNLCGAVAGATMMLGHVFGRSTPGDPKFQKCLDVTRELNEYIISNKQTVICPDYIKDYEFATPERKDVCSDLLFTVIDAFAMIMEREYNVTTIR